MNNKSQELNKQIEEFIKKGGTIQQIPAGVSAEKPLYGGWAVPPSSIRPGFGRQKLVLTP